MIDLRSDTVTQPSEAMRDAAAAADVGDDVYGEDPEVNALQSAAADLLGMEASLYLPSGTMANQTAAKVHTEHGQEILVERESHIYKYELGGLAQHSGLQTRPIDATPRGVITPDDVTEGIVEEDAHRPGTGLVTLENTHNRHGGTAIEPAAIDAAAEAAREHDVPVHLDGARLANAAVAHDVPVSRMTREVDSVMLSLSKGLGAPVGSVLAGDQAFIEAAYRVRKLFGGAMRQVGVIAAPARLALENVDRLSEDHDLATRLADGVASIEGLSVKPPETNIVLVDTSGIDEPAAAALERFENAGVLGTPFGRYTVRFVTHWDLSTSTIDRAIDRIATAIG